LATFFAGQRPRRLPVFFLLDTSMEMGGTFQVTMQDGLQVVKNELMQHPLATQHVYCGSILFGENATEHGLAPLDVFGIPGWDAQGICNLQPALAKLGDALMFDLIAPRANVPGDYKPLVFLVLGGEPADVGTWQESISALTMCDERSRPLIVTLVTRQELVHTARVVSEHVLVLAKTEALYMTAFFFWVARTIAKISEDCERGRDAIEFPVLPYGVVIT